MRITRDHSYWPGPPGTPVSKRINRSMTFEEWKDHLKGLENIDFGGRRNSNEYSYWFSGYSPEDAAKEMYSWKDPNYNKNKYPLPKKGYALAEHARAGGKGRTAMNADTMRIHVSGEVEGTPFQVVSYTDNSWSGYRWRVQAPYDHFGAVRWEQSGGAFYDDAPDHPEGGIAWAEAAVRKLLTKKPHKDE